MLTHSSMKRVGLAAFENKTKSAFDDLSADIQSKQAGQLDTQLAVFQSALAYFAKNHAPEIRNNPEFRNEFAKMCASIGVDPLAGSSSNKEGSIWANLLGKDVNDFYFELAVRIIEICRQTRSVNGGIISLSEVRRRLSDENETLSPVTCNEDDIVRAVKSLDILGGGFGIVTVANKLMIRSVPLELSNDQATLLDAVQVLGYVSISMLHDNLNWSRYRSETVLEEMVSSGLLWIDTQGSETEYWSPIGA